MKYDFNLDLKLSQSYEVKFKEWLESKGMTNVELAPKDCVWEDWDVRSPYDTYEIKYDRWFERTKNICLETYSNESTGSLGWFFKTKAKWLVVFYSDYQFWAIKMDELRDCYYNYPSVWRKTIVKQVSGYNSICWLAPLDIVSNVVRGDLKP
jgi:hypothetical protein